MLSRFRSSAPMLVALLALFFAVGGPSHAADATGRAVHLITGKDIKNSTVTGKDVKNRSLRAIDFRKGQLATGREVIGTDIIGSIHGDAGAVAAHSCTTADLLVGGAQVGDLPLLTFVGATPAPPGLTFEVLKISSPGHANIRFCNPTNVASDVFDNVGVRIVTLR